MNKLQAIDYAVFLVYFGIVAAYGYWIYKKKQRAEASTTDFFLAEGSLTWWAIGASLIASNISSEQFVAMSGDGFRVGIAVAAYEWLAAVSLIIVAVFFMPIYLKNRIYTMPQFLKERYNESVAAIMAVFWLFLYVCVNLTSILYLGSKAVSRLVGDLPGVQSLGMSNEHVTIIALAVFATLITIGGMKVIGYTDVIQVVVLIVGGFATTYLALKAVSNHFGLGGGALSGFNALMKDAGDHFHMILRKPADPNGDPTYVAKYLALPAAMYFGGQWVANLNYWGCNQYITQRALGADLQTARTGILFAGFLKLLMPIIVMLPGIAAYVLHKNDALAVPSLPNAEGTPDGDKAYEAILTLLPNGLIGLSMAALTAAIVASLAGKANSISTIYTLDLYKRYINPQASERKLVWIGRVVIVLAMIAAIALTWEDTLGIGRAGGFTFIQKYTGYVSPGILSLFLLGMFWKRTTAAAAMVGILFSFGLSIFLSDYAPNLSHENILYTAYPVVEKLPDGTTETTYSIPFLITMGWVFFFTVAAMVLVSLFGPQDRDKKGVEIDASMFRVPPKTMVQIAATLAILVALYAKFW
jgi:solute:Na+ symporter, SSS family